MAVNTQKLLPGSTFSKVKVNAENIKGSDKIDPSLNIYKKVIKIDKFFKDSLLLQSKEQNNKRKDLENQKREKKEKELETPKKFKGFEILKNALPKVGFLDSIKRFILFTFAGWLFTNLFQFLPKLLGFVKIISPVISWFEKGIGALFEGIVSFIDFGYKAYDSVRSFTKKIGGEKFAQKFDALSGALNTFLNLALIAGMSFASVGGFGGKGGKGGPGIGGKPRPGTGGRPRVTTSGGGAAGRPDLRNPLRQKPRITGGKPGLRNPLRRGPKVTTGAGGAGGGASKGLGKFAGKGIGKFAGKIPFVGPLIDFGIRRLIFREPLGKAAAGAVGAGAGQALGGFLGGSLGGIVGSVVPLAGTLLGAGAGTLIGSVAGGFIGDWIGTSLYDFIESRKDVKTKKMSSGGKVSSTNDKKKKKRKLNRRREILEKIKPGKDIGGDKEIEKIYPNPERKFFGISLPSFEQFSWTNLFFGKKDKDEDKKTDRKKYPNAVKTLLNVGDVLGSSGDWIGSLMRAGVQVALGQKPDPKSLAKTISSVLQNVTDPAIKGIRSLSRELLGFSGGGEVSSSILSSRDTLTLERSIESNLRGKFDDAIGVVKNESTKRGPKEAEAKPPIAGKDEMIEENIQRAKEGQFTVTGGNSDFWTLVAIASREDGDPQGWADVAQSIYNRVASGVYGAKTIQGIVTRDGQYEPTWKYPYRGSKGKPNKEWFNIKDAQTASKATGMSVSAMNSVAAALRNAKYQKEAASFVGGRTDFMGGSNKPGPGDVRRKENAPNNFFGWFVGPAAIAYGKKNPGPAVTPQLGDITVMQTKSKEDKEGFSLFKPSTWFSEKDKDQKTDKKDNVPMRRPGAGWKPPKPGKFNAIQYITGDKSHPNFELDGHGRTSNYHDHIAFSTIADKERAKRALRSAGIKIGSEYRPGDRGYHGLNLAIDVPGFQWGGSGAIGAKEFAGSKKVRSVLGLQGGGLVPQPKPNVPIPNSFASYNDPRQSSTLAVQPIIIEKMMPFPMDSPISFPSSGSSGVNNSMLPSLMQG